MGQVVGRVDEWRGSVLRLKPERLIDEVDHRTGD